MNTMPEVIENKEVQVISPMQQAHDFLKAGGDLVTMEKMMDLQDRFEKNEAKKLFFAAMVIAQKRMPVIYEGRNNKVTHSTYAAYKDIVRDSKPIYTGAGLAISFYEEPATKEDHIKLCADVYHEKGHSQTYSISLAIDDKGPKGTVVKTKIHGTKSAISYGRGILLCNIFNIPTNDDVDDDGNGAGSQPLPPRQITIGQDNVNWLMGFCKKHDIQDVKTKKEFQDHYGFDPYKTTVEQFLAIKTSIEDDYNEY